MLLQNMDLTNFSSNFTGLAISIFSRSNLRSGVIFLFYFFSEWGRREKSSCFLLSPAITKERLIAGYSRKQSGSFDFFPRLRKYLYPVVLGCFYKRKLNVLEFELLALTFKIL